MTSDTISKTAETLEGRGIPSDSFFEVTFKDGSTISEKEANWSSFSTKKTVDYFGRNFVFYVSNHPVKSIRVVLNDLEARIDDVPDGAEVYQFMRSLRTVAKDTDKTALIGRGIGLIKDGAVIEERFINAYEHKIQGMRK